MLIVSFRDSQCSSQECIASSVDVSSFLDDMSQSVFVSIMPRIAHP